MFVFYDTIDKQYLSWENSRIRNVSSPFAAKQFPTEQSAWSFYKSQLKTACTKERIAIERYEIKDLSSNSQPSPLADEPVYIMNSQTRLYLATSGNVYRWVNQLLIAKKGKNVQSAQGFVFAVRKQIAETGVNLNDLRLINVKTMQDIGPALAQPVPDIPMPTETPVQESPPASASGKESPPDILSETDDKSQSPYEWDLCEDVLDAVLADIPDAIYPLRQLFGRVEQAIVYCNRLVKKADLETADLLHKAEFATPNVVGGYRIYKEIHDCRIHRRKAKDMISLLEIIQTSGIIDVAERFCDLYSAYKYRLDTRTYHPRIRDDLFPPQEEIFQEETAS